MKSDEDKFKSEHFIFQDLLNANHLFDYASKEILNPVAEQETLIECTYTTNPKFHSDWWINMNSETFLYNINFKKILKLRRMENIASAPDKTYLENKGDSVTFKLIFPPIPKEWDVFSLIEFTIEGENGFEIEHIKRNDTGRYYKMIM